ncbi:MAG: helix-turn-helix transcriptional regulator [Thermoleophilia bacterium]|nr:helix-turn-helix transcriptional regulator [Thermoleophilia bacterium]
MTLTREKLGRRLDEPLVRRVFQRRGTVEILLLLKDQDRLRFTEIDEGIPLVAKRVVNARLAELRETGMIERSVIEGPPVSTRYSLTSHGQQLAHAADLIEAVATSEDLPSLAA